MGALATSIQSIQPRIMLCKFGQMLELNADAADRDAAESASVTSVDIWDFANENWGEVGLTTVKVHRARNCTCYPRAAAA